MDLVSQLVDLFGKNAIEDRPDMLAARTGEQGIPPLCIVKLQSAEQVQQLVGWANETNTPLIPVSSGGKFRRHSAGTPSVVGCVIADVSSMKRILSINYEFKMVTLEPGVTYAELSAELEKHGLCLDMPIAPKAEKSVIASVIEGEAITRPFAQWNAPHPLRCTEVVWGDGTRMYTGEANMGGKTIEQQQAAQRWQINPCGPAGIDYYRLITGAQGTMGIVTWASLKCSLIDNMHKSCFVPSKDVNPVIDFTYKMLHNRMCDELFVANRAYLEALTNVNELPEWIAFTGFSGRLLCPELRLDACLEAVEIAAEQSSLKVHSAMSELDGECLYNIVCSQQRADKPDWRVARKGGFKEFSFLSTLDKAPKFIEIMSSLADRYGYNSEEIGIYLQPLNCGVSCNIEFYLPFNPAQSDEQIAVNAIITEAPELLMNTGAYFVHPYGEVITKLQLKRNSENVLMLRRLKNIFDPQGIMNPGKLVK